MKDIIDLLGKAETGNPKSQRKYDRNVMRFVRPATRYYKVSFRECIDRLVHLEYIIFPGYPDFLVLAETNIIPPAHVSKLAYLFSAAGNELLVHKCEQLFRRMTTLECYVAGLGLQDFTTQADE